jgi:mannosyl-oligosaccharide glucosidase
MAWASKVMGDLAQIVDPTQKEQNIYKTHYETLRDNRILDELHWSDTQYADYGLHTDKSKLVRESPPNERVPPQSMPMIRKVEEAPKYQFVNSVGYVALFPMLLELIDASSSKLNVILDQIKDPKVLWTPYGLRSLARNSPFYGAANTEHDPPYWRSAIWININYLALKSLKHYSTQDGPYKEKAGQIYTDLRKAVVDNILKNYEMTGYVWEQYNDVNGKGQGSHPFTGWSALVVSIMAEIY